MARINKAPSTIFLTASVFPLMPGANLLLYDVRLCEAELGACHRTYDSPGGDLSDDRIWIFYLWILYRES